MESLKKSLEIADEQALARFAVRLASCLHKGDVVTLSGGLGAGKTALARAIIQALDPRILEVPSPSFTLVQTYDLPDFPLWHFDLYRLEEKETDILELGWDEAQRFGIVLVEWPERLGRLLPKNRLNIDIAFSKDSENSRHLTLSGAECWVERWEKF